MKKPGSIFLLAVGLLVPSCRTQTPADPADAQLSTVVYVSGFARYSVDGGKMWKLIQTGDLLEFGCKIQTAERSMLCLKVGERIKPLPRDWWRHSGLSDLESHPSNLLSLRESASVEILNSNMSGVSGPGLADQSVVLIWHAGNIGGQVKASPGQAFSEIRFSTNTIVRPDGGSVYSLSASGGVTIFKGKTTVSTGNSAKPLEIEAGQKLDPQSGAVTNIPAVFSDWVMEFWPPAMVLDGDRNEQDERNEGFNVSGSVPPRRKF